MVRTTEQTSRKTSTATPRDESETLIDFPSPESGESWEEIEQYRRADGYFRLEPGAKLQGVLLSVREYEDDHGERRHIATVRLTERCETAAWYDGTGCEVLGAMDAGKIIALDPGRHHMRPIIEWGKSAVRWEIFVGIRGKIKIEGNRTCWQVILRRRPADAEAAIAAAEEQTAKVAAAEAAARAAKPAGAAKSSEMMS